MGSDVKVPHSSGPPPLEALRALIAAHKAGSFTGAADALNLTHGAVSRRVGQVEAWAGFRLFERHGRGVRLSLDGQRLVAQVEQALALLDDSARLHRQVAPLDVVRVGIVPSFARLWMVSRMPRLEGTPQDLKIELDIDSRFMTLSDARIAIRYGLGDWAGVRADPLWDEMLQPVATPETAARLREGAPEELLNLPLIHDTASTGWRLWFAAAGIDYERRHMDRTLADYDLTLAAAAAGLGLAMLREPYGREEARRLGLVPVSERKVRNPFRFHLVEKLGPRHEAVERLVGRIRACVGESEASR